MSQAGDISAIAGPVPPTVPTSFTTDNATIAVPAANNLNVFGDFAITTSAGPADTVNISLNNFLAGSATTVGAVTDDAITLALGATPATYSIDIRISAFSNTDDVGAPIAEAGAGYNIFASVRTTGANAFLVGVPDKIINEDSAVGIDMTTGDVNVVVSGNDVIVRVLGVAGRTIRWRAVGLYTSVS